MLKLSDIHPWEIMGRRLCELNDVQFALEERDREIAKRDARIAELEIERDATVNALEKIKRKEGRVCKDFETCTHESCNSSYGAWAIADEALRCIAELKEPRE